MASKHWTDDYLVFAKPKDKISLAIMQECEDGDAAVELYNTTVRKPRKPKATHAVRITTYAGTIAQLKKAGWVPPKAGAAK
jgi:hypothetical protein